MLLLTLLGFTNTSIAQDKKLINIQRTPQSPKLNGLLDDATGFVSNRPEIGKIASKTNAPK
ncbi:hypothetical protein [Winogradskyella sp. PC D3.3]